MNALILLLVALSQLQISRSIKCYVGYVKWTEAEDCDSSAKYCMKTVSGQLTEFKCADGELHDECTKIGGADCSKENYSITGYTYCCCDSDYCVDGPFDFEKILPFIIIAGITAFVIIVSCLRGCSRRKNPAIQEAVNPDANLETEN